MHPRISAALACCLLFLSAGAAAQGFAPDTVTPDGIHIGSWSANSAPAKNAAPAQAQPQSQPQYQAPVQAPTQMQATSAMPAGPLTETSAGGDPGEKVETGHSFVVTSIQSCYDQLDPADVADIKQNYLKPYAECQARLEAKRNAGKEFKAGETAKALTPETPRNYVRVQAPDPAPAAGNSSR